MEKVILNLLKANYRFNKFEQQMKEIGIDISGTTAYLASSSIHDAIYAYYGVSSNDAVSLILERGTAESAHAEICQLLEVRDGKNS